MAPNGRIKEGVQTVIVVYTVGGQTTNTSARLKYGKVGSIA